MPKYVTLGLPIRVKSRPELLSATCVSITSKCRNWHHYLHDQLVEKPKKSKSNLAITGLYFFDNEVIEYTKKLKPSKRGELEIVDLLNIYKKKKKLSADFIGRGGSWLDTGNIDDFYDASNFISTIEKRQGLKIACLEELTAAHRGTS